VRETMGRRLEPLPEKARLARAQIGCEYDIREDTDDDGTIRTFEEPVAYGRERMYPTPDHASAGRISPKGIPCLYLSFEIDTAIYEMRPWIDTMVSIGFFKTTRELNIVNCTHKSSLTEFGWLMKSWDDAEVGSWETSDVPEPTMEQLEEIVWGEINAALSSAGSEG
jgi:RES domain